MNQDLIAAYEAMLERRKRSSVAAQARMVRMRMLVEAASGKTKIRAQADLKRDEKLIADNTVAIQEIEESLANLRKKGK